ncbi:hypothetical protein ACRALDRAFT_205690 [Sodiomyces alcalophilus JCM 7366]|uniref:uncharacterized protein n=1 Tax=Sodiomyces alcalophilus JCM 7366 TaxID=591952 RepID=UPI0039B5D158
MSLAHVPIPYAMYLAARLESISARFLADLLACDGLLPRRPCRIHPRTGSAVHRLSLEVVSGPFSSTLHNAFVDAYVVRHQSRFDSLPLLTIHNASHFPLTMAEIFYSRTFQAFPGFRVSSRNLQYGVGGMAHFGRADAHQVPTKYLNVNQQPDRSLGDSIPIDDTGSSSHNIPFVLTTPRCLTGPSGKRCSIRVGKLPRSRLLLELCRAMIYALAPFPPGTSPSTIQCTGLPCGLAAKTQKLIRFMRRRGERKRGGRTGTRLAIMIDGEEIDWMPNEMGTTQYFVRIDFRGRQTNGAHLHYDVPHIERPIHTPNHSPRATNSSYLVARQYPTSTRPSICMSKGEKWTAAVNNYSVTYVVLVWASLGWSRCFEDARNTLAPFMPVINTVSHPRSRGRESGTARLLSTPGILYCYVFLSIHF